MRTFLFILTLVCHFSVVAQERPNVVIIISDDHAYQAISAYDDKGYNSTPNIDRIAHEGILFNRAYVSNSICGPSRASILTGKYSHLNGFKDNETSHYNSSQNQFVNELQRAGYQTAWIGKYHLGKDPKGFDYYQILPGQGMYYNPDFFLSDGTKVRREGYVTTIIEDEAEKWLDNRDKNKPFLLVIGHKATHRTWMPDLEDLDAYSDVTFPLPETFYDDYSTRKAAEVQDMSIDKTMVMGYDLKMFPEGKREKDNNFKRMTPYQLEQFNTYYDSIYQDLKARDLKGRDLVEWKYQRYMRDYLATVRSLDRNIGRTLDYLDKHNLADNTIVIYMSDQGFYLGEHGWFDKRFMYEESFRTPMVMRYPKHIKPNKRTDAFVMNVDIAPTILEAAGVAIPADMQGKSFFPLVTGDKRNIHKSIFYHYYENGEHSVSPHFGIKTKRYKLIRFYKRVEAWELFDLKKDPNELHNIYNDKKSAKTVAKLKKELLKKIKELKDEEALKIFNTPVAP